MPKEYASTDGAALPAADEFLSLALDLIVPSLTNPRKNFDAGKLAELAESIKASGVHQPILVRPLPGARMQETSFTQAWPFSKGGTYTPRATHELVAGERRLRAAKLAGLATIPALVRGLTDAQVLEIQLVENLQRTDLTELEEAEGYQQLIESTSITADAVGVKIGKSRSYVFGRLKLLDLCIEARTFLRDGTIDASRALLIARIPDSALQIKALAEASRKDYAGDAVSVRAFQAWLRGNVMLRLDAASFKITDARLVKDAGSCKDCPKRTGANPDLFADVDGADICTDPVCFHGKEDAHRAVMVTQAEKKGMRLIEGKEAEPICDRWNSGRLHGYLPLSQVREDAIEFVKGASKATTLRDLLGKDAPSPVLIEHPYTKELIEAVPAEEAEALLVLRGLIKATQAAADKHKSIEQDIERLQDQLKTRIARQTREATYQAVLAGIRAVPDAQVIKLLTGDVLREWLQAKLGQDIDEEDMAMMLNYTFEDGVDEMDALTMHIRATSTATLLRALLIHMAMEDRACYSSPNGPTILQAMAAGAQIDIEAMESEVTKTLKAEVSQEIKKLKGEIKGQAITYRGPNGETWSGRGLKPRWVTAYVENGGDIDDLKKPLLPLASAAQAKGVGGEAKSQKTERPLRKCKLSPADAQAAIAAAMQGSDTNPGADAQGNDANSSPPVAADVAPAPSAALAVGMRVCVTGDRGRLPMNKTKWAGKEGTITKKLGDRAWMLTFKGRVGGITSFDGSELAAA